MRHWLVFRYAPVAPFTLKSSRATSTAGQTLLTPTPYAVKMAFLDAALRCGLSTDPETLVRWLAATAVRIGVPRHACVTGTIQTVQPETRVEERRKKPDTPPRRPSIAMREFVHFNGTLSLAFDLTHAPPEFAVQLLRAAPAVNYLGRRGSFIQYLAGTRQTTLDASFTQPAIDGDPAAPAACLRAALDDFGPKASFAALNSFSATPIKRGADRRFVETIVPFELFNTGPGFTHYVAAIDSA